MTHEVLRTILTEHWLTGVVCDHEAKTDRATCFCTTWRGDEAPNVGAAVQNWIDHVLGQAALSSSPAIASGVSEEMIQAFRKEMSACIDRDGLGWTMAETARRVIKAALSAKPAQGGDGALADIAAECKRHIDEEGWTPEHDDEHVNGELSAAAACYAGYPFHFFDWRKLWPWDYRWWKPTNRRHDLIKAGALIVAEIERLDRAERKSP